MAKARHFLSVASVVSSIALSLAVLSSVSLAESTSFVDDFESGNLNNWIIGGRQQGVNSAEVVSRGGSLVAHLYHRYFTEITLHRDFPYDSQDTYHFDLEVDTSSSGGAPANYYGWSSVRFYFLDSADAGLGYVWYGSATTSYPFNSSASNPEVSANAVPENSVTHHAVRVADMLSQITIDESQIDSIRMMMVTYSSTWPYPDVVAQLWIDNIQVNPPAGETIPAPGALLLSVIGMSCVPWFRRRKVL